MIINVRTPEGKRFWIPAPLWILKLGAGNLAEQIIRRSVPKEQLKYVECIDFSKLRKAVGVLKEYKGLVIVDVRAKDGTIVNIRL